MGIFAKLFAKGVAHKLKNDKDVQNAVNNTDQAMKNTRNRIERKSSGNKERVKKSLDPEVRKALGFDY